jgi:hypothetical protein
MDLSQRRFMIYRTRKGGRKVDVFVFKDNQLIKGYVWDVPFPSNHDIYYRSIKEFRPSSFKKKKIKMVR